VLSYPIVWLSLPPRPKRRVSIPLGVASCAILRWPLDSDLAWEWPEVDHPICKAFSLPFFLHPLPLRITPSFAEFSSPRIVRRSHRAFFLPFPKTKNALVPHTHVPSCFPPLLADSVSDLVAALTSPPLLQSFYYKTKGFPTQNKK